MSSRLPSRRAFAKAVLIGGAGPWAARAADPVRQVACAGDYGGHLQGVCADRRGNLYWCFTDHLVRTDGSGKVLAGLAVKSHHGDLCHRDGRVYVAVNFGAFNEPAGRADSWVYVYDEATLKELGRHRTAEAVHGAGGIEFAGGRFYVVGGLPEGVDENYVYEYDEGIGFQRRHTLASGHTHKGIQTACFAGGHWWFGCYGRPPVLLKADPAFRVVGRWEVDAALGLVSVGDDRFLIGRNARSADGRYVGRLLPAVADPETGLRLVAPAAAD